MELLADYDVLVIIGGWNRHIFTPEWISKFLLSGESPKDVEIPLNFDWSPRTSFDSMRIHTAGGRLNLTLRKATDEVLDQVQNVGMKVADNLPHTPVQSFGINFQFRIADEKNELFLLSDLERWEKEHAQVITTNIRREIMIDGQNINLSITQKDDNIIFDFNFHFVVTSLIDFKDKLTNNPILAMKKKAMEIMSRIYDQEFPKTEMAK